WLHPDTPSDEGSKGLQENLPQGIRTLLDEWNTKLQGRDLETIEEKVINSDKISHGLKEVKAIFQENLTEARKLQNVLSQNAEIDQDSPDLINFFGELADSSDKSIKTIDELIESTDKIKDQVKTQLKDLEQGDLAKAQKLLDDISAKTPLDHPIFPWYMQS